MRKLLIPILCFVCVAPSAAFADEVWMPKPDPVPVAPPMLTPEQASSESVKKHTYSVTGGVLMGVGGGLGLISLVLTATTLLEGLGCGLSDNGCSSGQNSQLTVQEGFAIGLGIAATASIITGAVFAYKGRGWNNPVFNSMSFSAAPVSTAGRTDGGTVGVSIRF